MNFYRQIVITSICIATIGSPALALSAESDPYMGAPVELVKAPNGAIANKKLLDGVDEIAFTKPEIVQPAEGIYTLGGYGLVPISVIETDSGLILFDAGDSKHDGEVLLEAIRTFSDKPVKAIIYGHSHTVMGAGVLAEGNEDILTIGHPELNGVVEQNLTSSGIPAFYPETGPYLMARAAIQFNAYLPKEGPDAWVVPLVLGEVVSAFIPVNTPVQDRQTMDVLGVKMQFFTKYGSDDKVHTAVWLPERRILFTSLLWFGPPQLYSLRGDLYRDPSDWIKGLKEQRDLNPDVLVSAGGRPVIGEENVSNALAGYIDGAQFMLDQTLRGILGGMGPDELRHFVTFPSYLDENPYNLQMYGEMTSYIPAIYNYAIGWYDNDAANIKVIAPKEEAARIVPLMGGRDQVIKEAQLALDKNEFAWAAQLINYLYKLDPEDQEVRNIKAEALRQMAYRTTGANDRAHMLSQALALENKVTIARVIPPTVDAIKKSPSTYLNFFRVRIDPEKSDATNQYIEFVFDDENAVGLHIRKAVAEFIPDVGEYPRKADMSVAMSSETWGKIYLSQATPEELVQSGEIKVDGDTKEFARVISLFDRYSPEKAVVVPPAASVHAR
jgi:alkyl sulfatase BDS1-like metallo-beta-lactamase superfamily hydrolase